MYGPANTWNPSSPVPRTPTSATSRKTVRNIHGCFHKALPIAVELGYLKSNPAANCKLPRKEKPDINPLDVNAIADFISAQTVYLHFKKIAAAIGHSDTRLHDLRHTYAVVSIQNGDDIKTVQENLGHHTAAFTLDTYAHVTNQMRQASAAHMEAFIQSISST